MDSRAMAALQHTRIENVFFSHSTALAARALAHEAFRGI